MMAEFTVFYSWQSDLPRKLSRDPIHDATTEAIRRLNLDVTVEDSPRIDHATADVSGTPEIAGTIYSKIRESGLFIADVSFIGESTLRNPDKPVKLLSNPNVMAELGYAAGKVGWDRVILVMNEEYGTADELPFDLRNRRFPLTFRMGQANRKEPAAIQQKLSDEIEDAIRSALQSEHSGVNEIIASLDLNSVKLMKDYGHAPAIDVLPRKTMGEILGNQHLDAAITRLLDKKVLRCTFHHMRQEYVYTWTYIGKLVLRQLGVTPPANNTNRPAIDDITDFFGTINVQM